MDDEQPNVVYRGEQLVDENSFFRRLPAGLSAEDRLRLDAVVVASDILCQAYRSLWLATKRFGPCDEEIGYANRALVLSQCWTMVDQLHAIRTLLRPLAKRKSEPTTEAFLRASQPCTLMRNAMGHLSGKLGNISKRKGPKNPLFGALGYVYWQRGNEELQAITIMSGTFHGTDTFGVVLPETGLVGHPVDLFILFAFSNRSILIRRSTARPNTVSCSSASLSSPC